MTSPLQLRFAYLIGTDFPETVFIDPLILDLVGKATVPQNSLKPGKNDLWLPIGHMNNGTQPHVHVILQNLPRVHVKLIAGKDLPSGDLLGGCDPYVEFTFLKNTKKSGTKMKTKNPQWNEDFDFDVYDLNAPLYVRLFDYDLGSKNDLLGEMVVTMSSLKVGHNDIWLQVPKTGAIHLDIDAQGFGQGMDQMQQQFGQNQQFNQQGQQQFNQFSQQNQQFNQFGQNQQQQQFSQQNFQQQQFIPQQQQFSQQNFQQQQFIPQQQQHQQFQQVQQQQHYQQPIVHQMQHHDSHHHDQHVHVEYKKDKHGNIKYDKHGKPKIKKIKTHGGKSSSDSD
jgi:hypothetical protein